jgi:hypothetical protein
MDPVVPSPNELLPSRHRSWGLSVRGVLLGSFLIHAFLVGAHIWPGALGSQGSSGSTVLLIFLAAVASGAAFSLDLPLQTILLAAAWIVAVTAGVQVLGMSEVVSAARSNASSPFPGGGPGSFSIVRLWVWLLVSFNSRALARLLLWRCRTQPYSGFWVLGLATAWMLLEFGFWVPLLRLPAPLNWSVSFPWNLGAEGLVALLIQVTVTPMLIRKRPGETRPGFYAVVVWVGMTLVVVCR